MTSSPTAAAAVEKSLISPPVPPEEGSVSGGGGGGGAFHLFPQLPPELRIKIWQHSFEPRVLEVHSRRTHYAEMQSPRWHSSCGNPAALSVDVEARTEALLHYQVALPLGGEGERLLYLDLESDTLVILGELDYRRLSALFSGVAALDPSGRGLRRVGLSVACWAHEFAGATLSIWAKTLFRQLEQFVLLMYTERLPPPSFYGGECVLESAEGTKVYMRFVMGRGHEFKTGKSWMVVGKKEMRVMNLEFVSRKKLEI
ncbi:hypothetical protein BX600DRAFT_441194 [Xylariales sp. PMI_506]|nr:hypothetical protein BX600DRAFT_441194 [Xylariales sp. PMI_506]